MRNNVPLTVHNKVKAAGILPGVVADILKKLFINADDNNSQLLIQILIINNPVGYVKEIILAVIGFLCLSDCLRTLPDTAPACLFQDYPPRNFAWRNRSEGRRIPYHRPV